MSEIPTNGATVSKAQLQAAITALELKLTKLIFNAEKEIHNEIDKIVDGILDESKIELIIGRALEKREAKGISWKGVLLAAIGVSAAVGSFMVTIYNTVNH